MVCILGGGKLGSAIAAGLLVADPLREVVLVVREGADTSALQNRFPSARVVDKPEPSDGVIVSVKPKDVVVAARSAAAVGAKRVLSVAAGVPLSVLSGACGDGVAVIRAMPNVGAQVQKSATGYCVADGVGAEDLAWVKSVLEPLGTLVLVDESQMDAVTGVSGSGIAFVLLVLEAMIDAAVASGLGADEAHCLAVATLGGAAVVASGDETPAQIRARVTTPGGTTAAGLAVLEASGLRDAFRDAIAAATVRSMEMGRMA